MGTFLGGEPKAEFLSARDAGGLRPCKFVDSWGKICWSEHKNQDKLSGFQGKVTLGRKSEGMITQGIELTP